jgi:large subunit ribosomal protein L31e
MGWKRIRERGVGSPNSRRYKSATLAWAARVYLLTPPPPRARAKEKGGRGGGAEMSEKKRGGGTRKDEVVTREYTINLHKRLHGWYRPLPFPAPLLPFPFRSFAVAAE